MNSVSRRTVLLGVGAAAIAPALPALPATAAVAPPFSLPAFSVGVYGEYNWRVFFAATIERAKEMWFEDQGLYLPEDRTTTLDAEDVSYIDAKSPVEDGHHPTAADCLAMGWDNNCDRCHNDVSVDFDNYRAINGDCVCQECMTPQEVDADDHDDFLNNFINEEYDATDPAIFVLLRVEDFADETIAEVLADEADLHPDCLHLMPFRRVVVSSGPAQQQDDGSRKTDG